MANKLGSLVVSLGLDAAEFTRGMSKSEYQSKQSSDRIKSQFSGLTRYVAGLGIGAALVSSIKGAADAGREIDRLSQLSNSSTQAFQEQAFAAQQVGIGQEKLADIFKDTQDKLGDFLQTGAGPLADFFENIAPKIGVTVEQFRSLSGPDALQLYVSSLQKANLSQAEMTFYMEAIASDSTLLLPLLRDNGKEMGRMANEAHRVGQVLDDETIGANKRFSEQVTILTSRLDALQLTVGNSVIPWINKLVDEFRTGIEVAGSFTSALMLFSTTPTFDRPADGAKKYREELDGLIKARERLIKAEGVTANTSGFDRDIEKARKRLDYFNRLTLAGMSFDPSDARPGEARAALRGTPTTAPGKPKGGATRRTGTQAGAGRDAFNGLSYDEQVTQRVASLLENSAVTKGKEYADVLAKLDSLYFDGALSGELYESALVKLTGATAEGSAQATRFIQEQERLAALLGATESAGIDRQREDMELLARAFSDGVIAEQQYLEAVTARLGLVADKTGEVKSLTEELGLTFSSAFEDAIVGGKGLSEVIKGLEQDILRLVTRKMVTEPLGNALTSALGSFDFGSLFSFDGGGYTGGGARAGGMDGKGGFLALLHPNETVLDHTRGQRGGGGGGNVYHINVAMPPGATRETAQQFGHQVARRLSMAQARNG